MDKEDTELLKKALRAQRPHEKFNRSLARIVSEKEKGKRGYKKYLDLISKIRKKSEIENCSIEEAVKKIVY